jgi:hypothetical protein
MLITGSVPVGDVIGLTAKLVGTGYDYVGYSAQYRIELDGEQVGHVVICEASGRITATATTFPEMKNVTSEWLDMFNSDEGDRDEQSALDRAAIAIFAAQRGLDRGTIL